MPVFYGFTCMVHQRHVLLGESQNVATSQEYMRNVLHWLPFPQRIAYRVSALVWRCLEGIAPLYLRELCCSTSGVQRRSALRSANQAELLVPRSRTTIKQRRSFSVAGPTTWNGLPVALRLVPRGHTTTFFVNLKTVLFSRGWTGSASE